MWYLSRRAQECAGSDQIRYTAWLIDRPSYGLARAVSALAVFFAIVVVSCTTASMAWSQAAQVVDVGELPSIVNEPYRIRVGDVLEFDFFKTTDLNQERTVGPDGEIFLPLVGRVKVMDRTVEDITRELTERYSAEMVNPQITVSVKDFSGLQVYVAGEVNSPGIMEYRGDVTLVQAIFDAGGFTDRARKNEVLIIRRGPDNTPVGSIVDVKRILRKGHLEEDVLLAPMDTVYVHHKKVVNVNLFVEQYISDNIPNLQGWWWWLEND